ncbi:MAG: dimethylsulfonioproprionate lyase family protein [Granulosicoccus sp.]
MAVDRSITSLIAHISTLLEEHDSDIANRAVAELKVAIKCPVVKSPQRVAQCEALDAMLINPFSHHMLPLANAQHGIHWAGSGGAAKPEAVQNRLAFAELVGPGGMIRNPHCRVGLFLQCAQTTYPVHRHAAEELYLVLGGTAHWQSDSMGARFHTPGNFIHHASWETHSMTTANEPLLAVWCWTGDIRFDQYEIESP